MRKIMRKSIALAGVFAAALGSVYAQADESLDRQVDVTRDYRPTVQSATKLSIQPNMTDTVQLRPDFDYVVKPMPINHGFGVTAMSPVSINAATYAPLYPFYAKVGGGYPGQSLADIYYNSTGRGKGSFGFYVNHDGHYNKIENDLGYKSKAMKTENSAGLNGNLRLGKVVLSGEAGFDYDMYSRYGQFNYGDALPQGPEKVVLQKFMTPRAAVRVGNDFVDLSRLNFAVTAGGYYFKDDFSNAETGLQFGLDFAKMFGTNKISLSAGYDGLFGNEHMGDVKSHLINVAPRYDFISEKLKMGLGLNFAFDINDIENKVAVLPSFDIALIANPAIVPFVDVDSRVERNSYRHLVSLNPYLNESWPFFSEDTYHYDLRAGISGTVSNVFRYKLYGGAAYIENAVDFANAYADGNSATFVTFREKRIVEYMVGLELEGRIASSFSAMLGGRYTGYDTKTFEHAVGLPDYEVSLKLKWNHKDRFFATAGLDLIGNRWFMEYRMETETLPTDFMFVKQKAVIDVNLGLEYRLKKELGIFIEGHNLTGSKLYPFNHYPEDGPQVSAGVKLMF